MKYVIIVPDGCADYACPQLDGKTPLEAASTPNMDRMAREGMGGLVQIIPEERPPGSDVGNLEIFGYDTRQYYTGRSPLEAASMGVELADDEVAFRCNLIYRDGDTLVDYSAGHIDTDEAAQLIEAVQAELGDSDRRFYPGVGYRHLLVFRNGPDALVSYPPHDIMGQSIQTHLPSGAGEESIRQLMQRAEPILAASQVNAQRRTQGKDPANAIWLWGSGRPLRVPTLDQLYGLRGGVISAVDLVRGIGKVAGWQQIEVPGITGYLDTNYAGKAAYALKALEELDIVYVHIEAPDEAGHNGDVKGKTQAIEDIDRLVVGPLMDGLQKWGEYRVLMSPDHRTPIALRTHSRESVPYVLWGSGFNGGGLAGYNEIAAAEGALHLDYGHHMMQRLIEGV
jgi:2,3-bisphosphoglycerate-independent phosphoglycerate mutase